MRRWLITAGGVFCALVIGFYLGSRMNRVNANSVKTASTASAPNQVPEGTPANSDADFAASAMKMREQSILKVEPQVFVTTSARQKSPSYPWKMNIVTTVFWIGEDAKGHTPIPIHKCSWNANWMAAYGGFDNPDPSSRRNYIPIGFTPRQNPFYCALPYNDVVHGQFKPEAPLVIPWFKQAYSEPGHSVCKDRWVAIRKGNRTCYAQWGGCGPFRNDNFQYVFLNERPRPNINHGAGLDVSPAVRDYLGLSPTDITDWRFVEVREVGSGPWRTYGDNNHFVLARRKSTINPRLLSDELGPDEPIEDR